MSTIRNAALTAAALLAFASGPAFAQSAAEFLGVYHMSILSKSGPECPQDDDEDLSIEIRRFAGARMMFGEPGKSDEEIAEYDPVARSFRFEEAGGSNSGVFTGRFTRQPDAVRLDMTVQIQGCTGTFAGIRPAPPMQPASPQAPGAPGPGGAPPAAGDDLMNPESLAGDPGQPPADLLARRPLSTGQMAAYGGWGLGLILALVGFWFVFLRRKPAAPAEPPQDPPAGEEK